MNNFTAENGVFVQNITEMKTAVYRLQFKDTEEVWKQEKYSGDDQDDSGIPQKKGSDWKSVGIQATVICAVSETRLQLSSHFRFCESGFVPLPVLPEHPERSLRPSQVFQGAEQAEKIFWFHLFSLNFLYNGKTKDECKIFFIKFLIEFFAPSLLL